MDNFQKRRVCVLVKAYPQPSQKYQETVCVAAVTEAHELVRLYPIRFRHLPQENRFDRFDWIEVEMTRAEEDPRPESFRVKEDTISIVMRGDRLQPDDKVRVWKPSVIESLQALKEAQKTTHRSLGIVKPDPGSIRFKYEPIDSAGDDDQETARSVYEQQSLIEQQLTALPTPEYVFRYQFTSGGMQHTMQLHDWEAEATYHAYKRKYATVQTALEKMTEFYQQRAPQMNLHLIMGNMHKRPWQFIIIGVLRTTADVDHADAQKSLL
jgi:hypothetical protein